MMRNQFDELPAKMKIWAKIVKERRRMYVYVGLCVSWRCLLIRFLFDLHSIYFEILFDQLNSLHLKWKWQIVFNQMFWCPQTTKAFKWLGINAVSLSYIAQAKARNNTLRSFAALTFPDSRSALYSFGLFMISHLIHFLNTI